MGIRKKKTRKKRKKMNNTTTLIPITVMNHTRLYMSVNCIIAVDSVLTLSEYPRIRKRDQDNDRLCSWREGR